MKMKDWTEEARPREKMIRQGAGSLSNAELLAIFIGSGVPGMNAVDVGQGLLSAVGGTLSALCRQSMKELMRHKGIGRHGRSPSRRPWSWDAATCRRRRKRRKASPERSRSSG